MYAESLLNLKYAHGRTETFFRRFLQYPSVNICENEKATQLKNF
jgi:hypothetical protein